jgi:hypothetical protein
MDSNTLIQLTIAIISLISVILIYKTIITNKNINKNILFSNITKEERELRIKLQEYQEKADNKNLTKKERDIAIFNYETILFNYYEYVAICLYKKLINKSESNLYFKDLLKSVKEYFESSLLFERELAKKEEYPGIQWLFKKWNIH